MIDHIEEAAALAQVRTREDLESDRLFFLALLKLVEIVGEAATRVSRETQVAYSEIPWREIIGTRNRLIHGYDAVDCDILWEIVVTDFPPLCEQLKAAVDATSEARPQDKGVPH
ncbi:MAG TPA: hypothetical protein DDX99_02640 [Desulfofustis sp.]|nr:hypothetical protein [Desulfofustis sp.]